MPQPKVQRWIDLLAALLSRRYPVSLEQLVADVPGYSQSKKSALRRMFERDKDDLRRFGVAIETVPLADESADGYRLAARDFYLPFLALTGEASGARAQKTTRAGYRALPTLMFEPDELDAVAHAAARTRQLGDPLLAADAESALRKLAVDLPMGAVPTDARIAPPRTPADADVFVRLGAALEARKRVTFDYRSIGTDATGRRTVEPYGLFFLNQHWYLAARADGDSVVKNFRLSRIADPEAGGKRPGTPDYEIPADFRLREHARSRQAWELGDGDAIEAVVEFRREEGAAVAAGRLGEPVIGHPDRRRFRVRRRDAFARWLLGFAGDLVPLEPPELVAEYEGMIARTLAVYGAPDGESDAAGADRA